MKQTKIQKGEQGKLNNLEFTSFLKKKDPCLPLDTGWVLAASCHRSSDSTILPPVPSPYYNSSSVRMNHSTSCTPARYISLLPHNNGEYDEPCPTQSELASQLTSSQQLSNNGKPVISILNLDYKGERKEGENEFKNKGKILFIFNWKVKKPKTISI